MLLNLILAQGTHFSQIFQISFRCAASPNPAETFQNPCRIALPRRFSASAPPGEPTESTGETPAGRNPDAPGSDARTFCKNLAARLHRPREKRICAFARKKRRPCVHFEKKHYLCPPKSGEMQEWLNWPAWKASKRQKRFRGSNPLLSAEARDSSGQNLQDQCLADFFCVLSGRILPLSGAGRSLPRRTAGYPSPEESRIRGADKFGAV